MSDAWQVVIVTAAAGAALLVLVRNYWPERSSSRHPEKAPRCANCEGSAVAPGAPRRR